MLTPFAKAIVIAALLVVGVGLGFAPRADVTLPAAELEQPQPARGV